MQRWDKCKEEFTRVGGEGDDSVARNREVALCGGAVVRQHGVDQAEELHHSLVLPQVLMPLHSPPNLAQPHHSPCPRAGLVLQTLCKAVRKISLCVTWFYSRRKARLWATCSTGCSC